MRALSPRPGDRVIDIGAGTGLLTLDLARAVGEHGNVIAIDPSAEMRSAASSRCADRKNVQVLEGTADRLPIDNGVVDGAVSLQVFEYLDDTPVALTEIRRVLRPGGRLVIGDLHWGSHIWHAEDRERMDRILRIWSRHVVETQVPALLPPLLREAGFDVEAVIPELCHDTVFRGDGLARMMTRLIRAYCLQTGLADADEVDAWIAEQDWMAAEGRFFFALTHYVVAARKL